jgi:leader peptidase (prepilin peptidase) / N-methyltransferase
LISKHERLPDRITVPLAWSGLAVIAVTQLQSLPHHVAGLVLGYASFRAIATIYRRWRDREGLGGGDAKLLAAAGAWVGWEGLPFIVLVSSASALVYTFLRGHFTLTDRIRFGPFLAFASWVVWAYMTHGARWS